MVKGATKGCKWCELGECWGCPAKVTGKGGKGKGGGKSSGKGAGKDLLFSMFKMFMGGGKGGSTSNNPAKKEPPSRKVFIGGLPVLGSEGLSYDLNKKLKQHFAQAGKCLYAEIGRKGTGVAVMNSDVETQTAVATLNGSVFESSVLEVQPWGK
eukprot:TRINITY_DN7493_c0_g2_i1.p1 TRINITY_DN7493_c0_g2~~TRINITY_DN7493_c0_g2_i1.p1  ORF type:complete len:154 (+),score=66.23 TRINITY_DN7493_c0_g2_i1:97-558(+)